MNAFGKMAIAALAGTIAPALPLVVLALVTSGSGFFTGLMLVALAVAAAHVVVLGIPAFLLLTHLRLVSGYSLILAGFVAGLLPIAVMNLLQPLGSDHLTFLFFGAMGAVSGLAFWFTWSRLGAENLGQPEGLRRPV